MAYRALCKTIEPKMLKIVRTLPRTPFAVEETPRNIADSAPSAYYYAPPETLDRPGTFFVNTAKVDTRPKFEMEVLSALSSSLQPRLRPFPYEG